MLTPEIFLISTCRKRSSPSFDCVNLWQIRSTSSLLSDSSPIQNLSTVHLYKRFTSPLPCSQTLYLYTLLPSTSTCTQPIPCINTWLGYLAGWQGPRQNGQQGCSLVDRLDHTLQNNNLKEALISFKFYFLHNTLSAWLGWN